MALANAWLREGIFYAKWMCTARKTSPPTTAYRFENDGRLLPTMDNSDASSEK